MIWTSVRLVVVKEGRILHFVSGDRRLTLVSMSTHATPAIRNPLIK
jgi:hypothetical protein